MSAHSPRVQQRRLHGVGGRDSTEGVAQGRARGQQFEEAVDGVVALEDIPGAPAAAVAVCAVADRLVVVLVAVALGRIRICAVAE